MDSLQILPHLALQQQQERGGRYNFTECSGARLGTPLLMAGICSLVSTRLGAYMWLVHSLTGLTWELAPIWAALCYLICIVSPFSQHDTNPDSGSLCFWNRRYSSLSPVTTMKSIWEGQAEHLTTMTFVQPVNCYSGHILRHQQPVRTPCIFSY